MTVKASPTEKASSRNPAEWPTSPDLPGPSSGSQRGRDLSSRLTWLTIDVGPAVTHDGDPELHDLVSATLVIPPPLIRVGFLPIEFHAQLVVAVQVVQIATLAVDVDARLTVGDRQSVRALDPVQVSVLEYRLDSAFDETEHLGQFLTPA